MSNIREQVLDLFHLYWNNEITKEEYDKRLDKLTEEYHMGLESFLNSDPENFKIELNLSEEEAKETSILLCEIFAKGLHMEVPGCSQFQDI